MMHWEEKGNGWKAEAGVRSPRERGGASPVFLSHLPGLQGCRENCRGGGLPWIMEGSYECGRVLG